MPDRNTSVLATGQFGNIKWMDPTRGFGMITIAGVDSGEDVFFHYSNILNLDGFKYIPPGTLVKFDLAESSDDRNNGYCALNITMIPAKLEDQQ